MADAGLALDLIAPLYHEGLGRLTRGGRRGTKKISVEEIQATSREKPSRRVLSKYAPRASSLYAEMSSSFSSVISSSVFFIFSSVFFFASGSVILSACGDDDLTVPVSENSIPFADAGSDRRIATGIVIELDGSLSDDADEDDVLSYSWTLVRPSGSTATLGDPTTVSPSLIADVAGTYTATLVVTDGKESSGPDDVVLVAEDPLN